MARSRPARHKRLRPREPSRLEYLQVVYRDLVEGKYQEENKLEGRRCVALRLCTRE